MIDRVLIVDDEPLARARVAELVRRCAPSARLREAGNGDVAVEMIDAWHPDVVLLDVQMPGRDGFAVIQAIGAERMPITILVTAHDTYALRAFDIAAVDYLLKPFDDERFAAAWTRATDRHNASTLLTHARGMAALLAATPPEAHDREAPPASESSTKRDMRETWKWIDRIVVKHDQRTIVVMLSDVQWIEADGNYVILHAGRERYQVRETLTSLESRLDPSRFVRIHRGTIVDMRAMRELQPWFGGDQIMILLDGTKLRVSRNYRSVVARRLAGER
ncbi:MAG: response regulator transcription factor [Gemmatimonadaceae bacterium]|nr:response regulator transcription factor [Gemmatimonadaceae bacterium]